MSYDLTGASLSGYMLKIIRDIVSRSNRFRSALGTVSVVSNNTIAWGDAQVIIKDVSADGMRLQADYFMCTQMGRSIVTKLADYESAFIEWANDIDATGQLYDPGVYRIGLDSVNEGTGDLDLIVQKFKWREGSVQDAEGTKIGFSPTIDVSSVAIIDPNGVSPLVVHRGPTYVYLVTPVSGLVVYDVFNNLLNPFTDYWVERITEEVIISSTVFGAQDASIPSGYESISIINQAGHTLRKNIDYIVPTSTTIRVSDWTPAGQTLSIRGVKRLDPSIPTNIPNPENYFNVILGGNETLVPDQVFVSTSEGTGIQITPAADGSLSLPTWLLPGDYCRWEVHISTSPIPVKAKKNSINTNIIPGVWVAIGDNTKVGDQAAIIVSPVQTQTYEVYGSKDNVRFTIDVKANDPSTASEICELIKDNILIFRRIGMESDGLAIFEAARSSLSGQKDNSGVNPTFTYSLSVTGAADWRVFVPLITRMTSYEVVAQPYTQYREFRGGITNCPRYQSLGYGVFIPEYK
jgi:hypothetical protein